MIDEQNDYEQQISVVMGLRISTFQEANPIRQDSLIRLLVEEELKLQRLRQTRDTSTHETVRESKTQTGNKLGAQTTQLDVSVTLCMHPLPTGIYHILDPETDPLLKVKVTNHSRDARRIRIRVGIEGISSESAKTIELTRSGGDKAEETASFLPTLRPGVTQHMNEVQRATIYVISEDLDNKIEAHDTYAIVCLSRNSSFNAVVDPTTGKPADFTHYYGAWVTPYDELVQERIRAAASLSTPPQIWGYQGTVQDVDRQVMALFLSLQQHGMKYVNSIIDYGAPSGYYTQRTRLPRESLTVKSANCIDGSVLMASMLEGASLNAILVIVPGHAFVGWETWRGTNQWRYIETTMMGEGAFDDACKSAEQKFRLYDDQKQARTHALKDLRKRGIWPMI